MIKKLPVLFFLIFAVATRSHAATQTAASCSVADVNTAIAAASNGDTVQIQGPAACTWAGAVTISGKYITLTGLGATTITWAAGGHLAVTATTTGNSFVTGFRFLGAFINGGCPITFNTAISPLTMPFRFYGNILDDNNPTSPATMLCVGGTGPGVIDHNTFTAHFGADEVIHNLAQGASDASGWTTDVTPGGPNMIFIETNTFVYSPTGNPAYFFGTSAVQNYYGARVVFRYNNVQMMQVDVHGTCGSIGGRWEEIYNNTFSTNVPNASQGNYLQLRGGSGVVFGNVHTGANQVTGALELSEDCTSGTYPLNYQDGRGINQTSSPMYFWQTASDTPVGPGGGGGLSPTYIQLGRDYFTSTTQPATINVCQTAAQVIAGCPVAINYQPYPYPHPLTNPPTSPQINFSPAGSFGTVNVGTPSTILFTISNAGGSPEVYSAISLTGVADYARATGGSAGSCPASGTIAASSSCTYGVTFTPAQAGSRTSTLAITGTANASLPLSGTGQSSLAPPAVPTNLTATLIGGNSVSLTWTPSQGTPTGYNCLGSLTSGGPYSSFGPGASPVTGPPCSISGLSVAGNHYFVINAFNSAGTSAYTPQVVVNIPASTGVANLNPSSLAFGSVQEGTPSAVQVVILTNVGTATLTGISIAAPSGPNGADFGQTNTCGSTLAVNATCLISVTFTPSTTGNETAAIAVTSSDPNSPETIALTGAGSLPVTVSPSSINFGRIYVNRTSAAQIVTYINQTGSSVTFSSVAITGGSASQFTASATGTPCSGTLASGAQCTVSVTATPTGQGAISSSLVFTDTTGTHTVALSATGSKHHVLSVNSLPGLEYLPAVLRFAWQAGFASFSEEVGI